MTLLAAHSNLAKHRMPAVAALRLAMIRPDEGHPLDPRVRIPDLGEGPLKVGDVLAETPRGVRVPVTLLPTVGINRPGTDRWPVLVKELDAIASWVRTQAAPILVTGTADVDPLPARYDTSVGHDDVRAAIAAGAYATAGERYMWRLGAAISRIDLPDLLAAHPDEPDRDSVDRWVASLDDDELLDRMSRFEPGRTIGAARQTMRVLNDLLAEVRAHDADGSDG